MTYVASLLLFCQVTFVVVFKRSVVISFAFFCVIGTGAVVWVNCGGFGGDVASSVDVVVMSVVGLVVIHCKVAVSGYDMIIAACCSGFFIGILTSILTSGSILPASSLH